MKLLQSSKFFVLLLIIIGLTHCQQHKNSTHSIDWLKALSDPNIAIYDFKVTATLPHDPQAFTEGLFVENNLLYESSGLYNHSKLQRIDLRTGHVLAQLILPQHYFAEGIAIYHDALYQLTYESHIALIYDKNTFQLIKTLSYPTQGWGLTTDGEQLVMSNGSEMLIFLDPHTFKAMRYLRVTYHNQPITLLNSLAFIQGKIFANIWGLDIIAIISPQTGHIEGLIDLRRLNPMHSVMSKEAVLNGIAYDETTQEIIVTGKLWSQIYKIQLLKK